MKRFDLRLCLVSVNNVSAAVGLDKPGMPCVNAYPTDGLEGNFVQSGHTALQRCLLKKRRVRAWGSRCARICPVLSIFTTTPAGTPWPSHAHAAVLSLQLPSQPPPQPSGAAATSSVIGPFPVELLISQALRRVSTSTSPPPAASRHTTGCCLPCLVARRPPHRQRFPSYPCLPMRPTHCSKYPTQICSPPSLASCQVLPPTTLPAPQDRHNRRH